MKNKIGHKYLKIDQITDNVTGIQESDKLLKFYRRINRNLTFRKENWES